MRSFPLFRPGAIKLAFMLCALILLLHGCANSAARISANLRPAPMMPGAVVTESWSHQIDGALLTHEGQWVHLPASEAGELLLWIEHAEDACS